MGPKPWGRELLIAHTKDYTGRVSWMRAGESGPLQYHERKDETAYLFSGRARVTWRDAAEQYHDDLIQPGDSWHIPPGAVHQMHALEDSVIFECSNAVFEDRVAVTR